MSPPSYVVTGFYTPSYAHLAAKLMADLDRNGAPHSIFAIPSSDWLGATLQKPTIVRRAMAQHPDKSVILMDVDCIVRGDIAPVADFAGDVGVYISTRRKGRRSIRSHTSSRVVVFQPTAGARALAAAWESRCKANKRLNDEQCLLFALSELPKIAVSTLDVRYAAREIDQIGADAIIVHESQHASAQHLRSLRAAVKRYRRRLIERLVGRPYEKWKYLR